MHNFGSGAIDSERGSASIHDTVCSSLGNERNNQLLLSVSELMQWKARTPLS
jgi:hypothetical protein